VKTAERFTFAPKPTAPHRKSKADTDVYSASPRGTKLTKNEAKYANVCSPLGTQQVRATTFQSNLAQITKRNGPETYS
jgi:hypothetical protein